MYKIDKIMEDLKGFRNVAIFLCNRFGKFLDEWENDMKTTIQGKIYSIFQFSWWNDKNACMQIPFRAINYKAFYCDLDIWNETEKQ